MMTYYTIGRIVDQGGGDPNLDLTVKKKKLNTDPTKRKQSGFRNIHL